MSLLAGALAALSLLFLLFQSATQDVATRTTGVGSGADQPTFPPTSTGEVAGGQIIVELGEEATRSDLAALDRRNGASTEVDLPSSDVNVVDLPEDLAGEEAVWRYEASPDVEYPEPDFLLRPTQTVSPNAPYYSRLFGHNNTGQTGGIPDADVDASEAWGITTGSPTTVVAVIDEGVDINRPDLRGNIWVNADEVPNNGVDDDRNGYDFANDDASVYDRDPVRGKGNEHGTHVAGTIAAQGNNGTSVTGVTWRAGIMVLEFLGALAR